LYQKELLVVNYLTNEDKTYVDLCEKASLKVEEEKESRQKQFTNFISGIEKVINDIRFIDEANSACKVEEYLDKVELDNGCINKLHKYLKHILG
jgi:hypothetical protein